MRQIGKCALLLGLIFSLGAHWAVLQSVAWMSMFAAYSRTASYGEAVRLTFDGQHPCVLCSFVISGKQADDTRPEQQVKAPTFDLFLETPPRIVTLTADRLPVRPFPGEWKVRTERPSLPPPRIG